MKNVSSGITITLPNQYFDKYSILDTYISGVIINIFLGE